MSSFSEAQTIITSRSIDDNFNPYEKNDFHEARTGDLTRPVKRSKSINGGGWISTDYRNKLAIDIGGGGNIQPLYKGYGYRWRISPRYRINDKISIRYVLSIRNKYNDIGFVTNDTLGLFIAGSFGSSMVLLFGFPESPFAQPKNVFFGHLVTALVGVVFVILVPLPMYINIALAVGVGIFLMILLNIVHPPAGGNPIMVIIGSVSIDYIVNPRIIGSVIILFFGIILNRLILKKKYPI